MSIKGTTQEMFVGNEKAEILTLIGRQITVLYSELKRIDYCYAERLKPGYMDFITFDNNKIRFDFGYKCNEPITKTIDYIQLRYPGLPFKEYQQGEAQKDRTVYVVPIFGHKELGLPSAGFTIKQKYGGEVYLNDDTKTFYFLMGYEWGGPNYDVVSTSSGTTVTNSETTRKGKALKIGAGALIGAAFNPTGALIGAAMGAGSKGKSKTSGSSTTNSSKTTRNLEKDTNATITLKCEDDGKLYRISFKCNSELDSKIKCFDFAENKKEVIKDTTDSLKGIKALKELLDMGAITQEEFEFKKQQILGM